MKRGAAIAASGSAARITDVALVFPHQLFASPHPAISAAVQCAAANASSPPAPLKKTRAERPHRDDNNTPARAAVVIVEEHLFFTQYTFHKAKLVFHRATMKLFESELRRNAGQDVGGVHYVDCASPLHDIRQLIPHLKKRAAAPGGSNATLPQFPDLQRIHVCDVVDDWLRRRLLKAAAAAGLAVEWHASPNFMTTPDDYMGYFEAQRKAGKKPLFMASFYSWQRKRLGLLLTKTGEPVGGKWSFDSENRKRVPAGHTVPKVPGAVALTPMDERMQINDHLRAAIDYVEKHFPSNYGSLDAWGRCLAPVIDVDDVAAPSHQPVPPLQRGAYLAPAPFPVSRHGCEAALTHFLRHRFRHFGEYEDAMVSTEPFIYHSLLAPAINVGLLDPRAVVDAAIAMLQPPPAVKTRVGGGGDPPSAAVPIASVEGFVRQIIGWREFVRAAYDVDGRRQRISNSYRFTRRIPLAFWEGRSGIAPLDMVTKRVLAHGYCHHIERLMVVGCFFLLCEFHPDDVYRWFMELFVDSLDWVMVPNVYGMSQGSDGGQFVTKPYVCGSNYLLKMGDWGPAAKTARCFPDHSATWVDVWDGLFWRFIDQQRERVRANPRLGMLVSTYDKMAPDRKATLRRDAEWYLSLIDSGSLGAAPPPHTTTVNS